MAISVYKDYTTKPHENSVIWKYTGNATIKSNERMTIVIENEHVHIFDNCIIIINDANKT